MTPPANHQSGCGCQTCERLRERILPTEEWKAEHQPHGHITTEPFPHPSEEWVLMKCICGASHLGIKGESLHGTVE